MRIFISFLLFYTVVAQSFAQRKIHASLSFNPHFYQTINSSDGVAKGSVPKAVGIDVWKKVNQNTFIGIGFHTSKFEKTFDSDVLDNPFISKTTYQLNRSRADLPFMLRYYALRKKNFRLYGRFGAGVSIIRWTRQTRATLITGGELQEFFSGSQVTRGTNTSLGVGVAVSIFKLDEIFVEPYISYIPDKFLLDKQKAQLINFGVRLGILFNQF
jgi:hypothetical protein